MIKVQLKSYIQTPISVVYALNFFIVACILKRFYRSHKVRGTTLFLQLQWIKIFSDLEVIGFVKNDKLVPDPFFILVPCGEPNMPEQTSEIRRKCLNA